MKICYVVTGVRDITYGFTVINDPIGPISIVWKQAIKPKPPMEAMVVIVNPYYCGPDYSYYLEEAWQAKRGNEAIHPRHALIKLDHRSTHTHFVYSSITSTRAIMQNSLYKYIRLTTCFLTHAHTPLWGAICML